MIEKLKLFFVKYSKAIIFIVLLIVISIPIVEMIYLYGINELYSHFFKEITEVTGVNQYLAKAVLLAFMVPLVSSFKLVFSVSSNKRRTGYGIITVYTVLFYFAMFFLTKEQKFHHATGEATKYYAMTPEGIRYFDSPGYDPKYGIPLKPVTTKIIRKQTLEKQPIKKIETPANFFDFTTGEPLVWYYETLSGELEFYDQPGFHPVYSENLKEITPEIIKKYTEKSKEKAIAQKTLILKGLADKKSVHCTGGTIKVIGNSIDIFYDKNRRMIRIVPGDFNLSAEGITGNIMITGTENGSSTVVLP